MALCCHTVSLALRTGEVRHLLSFVIPLMLPATISLVRWKLSFPHGYGSWSLIGTPFVLMIVARVGDSLDAEAKHGQYLAIDSYRIGPPRKILFRVVGPRFETRYPLFGLQQGCY